MSIRPPSICLVSVILALPLSALAVDDLLDLNDEAKGRAATEDMLDRMTGSGFRSLRGEARTRAMQAIFANPQKKHIPDLCAILTQEVDDTGIEQQALAVALRLGGPDLISTGAQLLQHAIAQRQGIGIQLLGASQAPDTAIPILLEAARDAAKSRHTELRFEFMRAFIRLKSPAAGSVVREWARDGSQPENAQWARLWMAIQGDTGIFQTVLSDHEAVQKLWRMTAHEINVMAAYWTPIQMRDARKLAARCEQYAGAFDGLLMTLGEPQMKAVVAFLGRQQECFLPDLLYQGLDRILTPANGGVYLLLLEAPYPRLQEEIACRLAESGDVSLRTRVCEALRAKQKGASYLDRALAVRLVELFAAEERGSVITGALADSSSYVVEEGLLALRRLRPANTAVLIAPVLAEPRWRTNGRIQWLLQRLGTPGL